jgi:chromosomal replication initiator protein
VKRLTAYREILDDAITINSVKRAIKDVIRIGTYIPTPEVIIEETARFYSLSADDLRGQRRSKNTAMARQVSMYLMRSLTNLSLKDIGDSTKTETPSRFILIRMIEDLLKKDEMTEPSETLRATINSGQVINKPCKSLLFAVSSVDKSLIFSCENRKRQTFFNSEKPCRF